MDLSGESGIYFCESLKKDPRYEHLPVIALSAFPHELYEDKALSAGC
jgi:CheY-like chemotaxis protein